MVYVIYHSCYEGNATNTHGDITYNTTSEGLMWLCHRWIPLVSHGPRKAAWLF